MRLFGKRLLLLAAETQYVLHTQIDHALCSQNIQEGLIVAVAMLNTLLGKEATSIQHSACLRDYIHSLIRKYSVGDE